MADESIRIGMSRLTVGICQGPGAVAATLQGSADESALATILEAGLRLLEDRSAAVVWDLRGLERLAGPGGEAVVRVMREVQRLEKEVRLVACGEETERQLRAMGLRGDFWHYPSLAAATGGAMTDGGHTVTVHLHRTAATRARLRLLVASLARPCGLDEEDQARLVVALDDVCGLAAGTMESPQDERLTLAFFARGRVLTVDMSWPVPPAVLRRTEDLWSRRPEARARLVAALDTVETLMQADGFVVRLTKQTGRSAAAQHGTPALRPSGLDLPLGDTAARQSFGQSIRLGPPRRGRRPDWREWMGRRRLPFTAGLLGRAGGRGRPDAGEVEDGKRRE